MTSSSTNYQITIGLEIHAQLKTNSKAFSADPNRYGAPANTMVSPYTLGHPGTLPRLNKEVVHSAILMGLACQSKIHPICHFARKNYFYADLPKGYQITQREAPICEGGSIPIRLSNTGKSIALEQIQIEEDSGKSFHQKGETFSRIDLNRAGVPLLEIVTRPCIESPEEAHAFVREIRRLLRYLNISDANMEEGSLRCDANISVQDREYFDPELRVEVKNINSMNYVKKALEFEIHRQKDLLVDGGKLKRETRRYDPVQNRTFSLRSKEEIQDYRYFPEPDLPPLQIQETQIEALRNQLPELPWDLETRYVEKYGLREKQAQWLTDLPGMGRFFQKTAELTPHYQEIIKWLMGPVQAVLKEKKSGIIELGIQAQQLAELIDLIEQGSLSHNVCVNQLFPLLLSRPNENPRELAAAENLLESGNNERLMMIIQEIITKFPVEVKKYREGKSNLLGFFMGEVMKATQGKADPKAAQSLLKKYLS